MGNVPGLVPDTEAMECFLRGRGGGGVVRSSGDGACGGVVRSGGDGACGMHDGGDVNGLVIGGFGIAVCNDVDDSGSGMIRENERERERESK